MTMRLQIASVSLAAICLVAAPLSAQQTAVKCKDGTTSAVAGSNACAKHGGVDAPATKAVKKDVTAQEAQAHGMIKKANAVVDQVCADGSTSVAKGKDACAKHGGVASATAVKVHPPAATPSTMPNSGGPDIVFDDKPAGAIAKCRDGKYSHAKERKGSCRGHSGVADWL
jgi:hypothetical protein